MSEKNNKDIKSNNKNLFNKILLIILMFSIVLLIIVYQFVYKPTLVETVNIVTAKEIAQSYRNALIEKDFDEVNKYIDYNGLLTYVSLYNNWSYDMADEWDKIYDLSKKSEEFDNMKIEIQNLLVNGINELDFEAYNLQTEVIEDSKLIDGTKNLYKVVIRVLYKNEGFYYDDEIYLVKLEEKYYIVGSSFIEDIANLCTQTLITDEYTLKNSLEYAIDYIESQGEVVTRSKLESNLYEFRFCTFNNAKKDLTVYNDNTELKDGDKIYLVDLYAEDDADFYEITLNIKDGHMDVGKIKYIEK